MKTILARDPENIIQMADAAEFALYGSGAVVPLDPLRKRADRLNIPVIHGAHPGQDWAARTASMRGVLIDGADLSVGNLSGLDLSHAVIANSNLQKVNLRGACLDEAILTNVDLTGADLSKTRLNGTVLVNCHLKGVTLNGVVGDGLRLVQSTLSDTTITDGVLTDLIVEKSVIDHVSFDGNAKGIIINGLGLYDSMMVNSHFGGNTRVNNIELQGSLMLADGPGILTPDVMDISPTSDYRSHRVHMRPDDILGTVRTEMMIERGQIDFNPQRDSQSWARFIPFAKSPVSPGLAVFDLVSVETGVLGTVPVVEHLARQKIGCQPAIALLNPQWRPGLLLPSAPAPRKQLP